MLSLRKGNMETKVFNEVLPNSKYYAEYLNIDSDLKVLRKTHVMIYSFESTGKKTGCIY